MSTAPVLSPRALQESVASPEVVRSLLTVPRLLRKNHNNFVSIKVGDEIFLRVHRPVATRFSPVWKRELQNVASTVVTVTFPPDPPAAPVVTQPKPKPEDIPVPSEPIPPPPPPPSNRTALKFIVQWMEQGGADPNGNNAVPYPKGYRAGLEKVLAIATMLQVSELVTRLKRDLGRMPPRRCPTCGAVE